MADEDKPVDPIVRKKEDPSEAAAPAATEAPVAAADPVDAQPDPPAPTPESPVPNLGRRVVDMSTHKPKTQKRRQEAAVPESILQPRTENPTSPERPSAKPEPQVRVQAGSLEDFEALLAETGSAPSVTRIEVGEKVEGTVTSVGGKWAYIDLGGGQEGLARVSDFTDKDGTVSLEAGTTRSFFVIGTGDGTISLGDQLSTRESAMDAIETAAQTGVPLNGRVTGKNKGGFEVDLGGVQAFCPISQIELAFTENPDEHLGRSYAFRVTEVREGGRSIVVSRAALLREEQERAAKDAIENVQAGMVVDGTVTRLAEFGAFVDIGGGVEGLIHVSELGFTRVDHPNEVVQEGEKVRVKVLNMDQGERGLRIGLSMKETMADPWESAMSNVFAGAKLSGTVNRLEPFGAFVEVAPNVEGLVHVSEMSWEQHVKSPSDIVSVGQIVAVEVLDVDLVRRRISLSMKGAAGDPWSGIEERFVSGQEVSGTVENIEDFGVFIGLGNGITALLPRSEMQLGGASTPHAKFTRGDSVTARVLAIDAARRRISLSLKSAEDVTDGAGSGPRSYSDDGASGLGTFGDLLKDKVK